MNIEAFCLCDAATNEAGKLNMLGAFDTIWVEKFPILHPHCAVAVRLRFDAIEKGNHPLSINIVDADGRHIVPPLSGVVTIAMPDGQATGTINFVVNVQGLKIEKPGTLSIDLAVDGRHEMSLPIYIRDKISPNRN